jgi:hypothetical protein
VSPEFGSRKANEYCSIFFWMFAAVVLLIDIQQQEERSWRN